MFEGMSIPSNNVYARSLIWRMFKDAADEDYLVARWAAKLGLSHQFYWSAQQAIEKYIKATLLLNDLEAKSKNHEIVSLFNRIFDFSGDLLPCLLCPPSIFPDVDEVRKFRFQPFVEFIQHIEKLGNPDIRYRHFSVVFSGYDLHKFDEACFLIRRLCMPLDLLYGPTGETYRQYLSLNRRHQIHNEFSFESLSRTREHPEIIDYLKWRNFSFYWEHAVDQGAISTRRSMQNSAISMYLKVAGEGTEAVKWLLEKAQFKKDEKIEMLAHLRDIESQA